MTWRARWIRRLLGAAVIFGGAAVAFNALSGIPLLAALGLAVVASVAMATLLAAYDWTAPPLPETLHVERLSTTPPSSYLRFRQLVRWSSTKPYVLSDELRRELAEITADRLLARHGVELHTAQGRELVGDELLWRTVTDPVPPTGIDATALDRLTRKIEDL